MRAVSVPDHKLELWERAAQVALEKGMSLSALIMVALQQEVDKHVPEVDPNWINPEG